MLFDEVKFTKPGEAISSLTLNERKTHPPLTYTVTASGDEDVLALMAIVRPLFDAKLKPAPLNPTDM